MVFKKGEAANPGGISKMPEKLRELCRARTREAVVTLSEIMNDKKQPAAARVTAASALMDRGWGRPSQQIEVDVEHKLTFVDLLKRAAVLEKEDEAKLIEGEVIENGG